MQVVGSVATFNSHRLVVGAQHVLEKRLCGLSRSVCDCKHGAGSSKDIGGTLTGSSYNGNSFNKADNDIKFAIWMG